MRILDVNSQPCKTRLCFVGLGFPASRQLTFDSKFRPGQFCCVGAGLPTSRIDAVNPKLHQTWFVGVHLGLCAHGLTHFYAILQLFGILPVCFGLSALGTFSARQESRSCRIGIFGLRPWENGFFRVAVGFCGGGLLVVNTQRGSIRLGPICLGFSASRFHAVHS